MIIHTGGKNTVNLTSMQAKARRLRTHINMTALRASVLAMFAVSVAVTVWSMLVMHNHILHMAHVALITLTFLLIALYLLRSADIASLRFHRELRLRMTVDTGASFAEYLPEGAPVFNACVGALARNDIYVKDVEAMSALARLKTIAVEGNSESREGYPITKSTLFEMGIELTDDTSGCPVRIVLGSFDHESNKSVSFVLIKDKITHVLIAVYVSRAYIKFLLYNRALLIIAIVGAVALLAFGLYTYAAAAISVWAALQLIIVRQIEKKTSKLTFKSIKK